MQDDLTPSELSTRNIRRLVDPTVVTAPVVSEISASEKRLAAWKQRIVKWYELYKMVQSKKHYDGLANIFVPEILRATETVVGNLYKVLTGQTPFFEYAGREKTDDGAALAMTQLVMYQMDENNFKTRLMDSLRQMVITGLSVRKIGWDFQQVYRTRQEFEEEHKVDALTGKPNPSIVVKKKGVWDTVKDHWTYDPVDLLSFHISDINTPYNDIQKARWIAEQYIVDRQWIKERVRKGWISDEALELLDSEAGDKAPSSDSSRFKESRSQSSGFTLDSEGKNKYEIIERWGLCPAEWVHTPEELEELGLDADDAVESVIIIANRQVILKLEPNPFYHNQKPYVSCPYVPQEYQFDGIGIAQIGEKLQEELNDTRNQTMDNKTLILMTMWLKSRSSGINNKDLRVRPLGVIPTNDINGLVPLRPPLLTGTGVNIEGVIKEDLRQSVGASSNLQGIAQGGVDTATESSIVNRESMGRLVLSAQLYGELMLKPTLCMVEYLNYQFYDHIRAIKIIGPTGVKFRKLSPKELIGKKDVVIKINTDVDDNPAVKRQQLLQFLTIVQQMPPEMLNFHWKLLDKIYHNLSGGRSLEELYQAPPQAEDLLSIEEEVDLVLAEYPVQAKMREDLQSHLQGLIQEFDNIKWALSQESFQIFTNLIMQYQELLNAQMEAMQAQFMAQAEMVRQGQSGGGDGKNKNNSKKKMDGMMGQMPNTTAFTQSAAPSEAGMMRDMGGAMGV